MDKNKEKSLYWSFQQGREIYFKRKALEEYCIALLLFCGCCDKLLLTWWSQKKTTIFIFWQCWRLEVWNKYHWAEIEFQQGCTPSRGLRKSLSVPCFFQFLVTGDIPWLRAKSSNFCHCGHIASFSGSVKSPSTSLLSGYLKLYLGPTQITLSSPKP